MGQLSVAVLALVGMAALTVCQVQEGGSCVDGDKKPGTCNVISSCPPLQQMLQDLRSNTARPDAVQFLRHGVSVCGYRGETPLVCCAGDTTPKSGGGLSLLPSRCGVTGLTDRIIDGEDAHLLAWPWMALLRGRAPGQPSTFFCGGVLINERYVLTAAHCFKPVYRITLEFVRLGEHTISQNPDCEHGLCAPPPQDIPAEVIINHPEYESPCRECNDIALIRLARPATLNPLHVVPICVPVDPLNDMGFPEEEFQGKYAWAAGWGSISRNPLRPVTPDKLQQVFLPIDNGDFCQRELRSGYPDSRTTLCAGGESKDTCKGDSGGPLVLSNRAETKRFVVGITSLGPKICGKQATQGLYTNVHYYVPWILDNLRP